MVRAGVSEQVALWEDGLRVDTGPGFFEWWYFDAYFDDGTTAVITFMTKSILERKRGLNPGILVAVTLPGGDRLTDSAFYPFEEFKASQEQCDVRIGPNHIQGDLHTYHLHVEVEHVAADLTFTGLVPPWRPGDGKAYFGDYEHFFAWLPSIPYGSVEGTLVYDEKVHEVKGYGYHDHNWGNIDLPKVLDHWYWGRAHIGDFTLIYVEQIATKAYGSKKLPVFMLAKGDEILTGDGNPLTLVKRQFVNHEGGRQYPMELDFIWEKGNDRVQIALRRPVVIEATSLLNMFPRWKQKVLRLFANPYYFRFTADMDLTIDFGDIHAHEQGPTIYELMMLR